jgi:dynein heavy chain
LLQGERLSGKCLFFVRVNPKGISEKTLESDVAVGEIQGSALDTFKALLADLFLPLLQEQSSWGKMPPQHTKDFLTGLCWQQHVYVKAAGCEKAAFGLRLHIS